MNPNEGYISSLETQLQKVKQEVNSLTEQNAFLEGCRKDWSDMAIKLKEKLNIETDVSKVSKALRKKDSETLCAGFVASIESLRNQLSDSQRERNVLFDNFTNVTKELGEIKMYLEKYMDCFTDEDRDLIKKITVNKNNR